MDTDPDSGNPASQPIHLLRTKLFIPPPHPDRVERPLLFARLDAGLRARLVLVSAPAGFGKTTLLSTWISLRQVAAAWVALDRRDNDPTRFWSYFLAALQTRQPDLGRSAQAMLQTPQPPPLEAILTSVLNEISLLPGAILLVLDDYHTIENPDIHQGIAFLLEHASAQLHLLIASRSEPPLPLPALRVRRELVELGPDDLRFSHDEAAAFLSRVMKLDVSSADINLLEQETEGWIAGLQLAALSLQTSEDISSFIHSFSGSHHYVFDYLAQEVLQQQPVEIQEFLLQSSILDNLSGSTCDAVLGRMRSQLILEQLEHAHLFLVPLDQQRSWYRYHHLFSEFLRTRLQQLYPREQINALRLRASTWYDQQGHYLEAIEQALDAEDTALSTDLIVQNIDTIFANSELTSLLGWIDRLPADIFEELHAMSITAAWAYHSTGRHNTAQHYLDLAETALGVKADGSEASRQSPVPVRLALAEIICIRASLAFVDVDLEAVEAYSKLAREYLDGTEIPGYYQNAGSLLAVIEFNQALVSEYSGDIPGAVRSFEETKRLSQLWKNPHLLALSNSHLAHLLVIQGKLRQAAQLYQAAIKEAEAIGSRPSLMSGMVRVGLGNILYEWNELDQARRYLEEGIELGKQWANIETTIPGYVGLARFFFSSGNPEHALFLLEDITRVVESMYAPLITNLIAAERAWLLLKLGEKGEAQAWIEGNLERVGGFIHYMQEEDVVYLARLLTALNRHQEALQLSDRLLEPVETGGRTGRLVEVLVIRALAFYGLGETAPALDALQRSLNLAEPEGYQRIFMDAGANMKGLLALVEGNSTGYAKKLLSSFGKLAQPSLAPARRTPEPTPPESEVPIEALSERELEVLRLIAQGYSNQQIADQLYISLNTTKTHVKNILGRLQVENRTQAAARAHELGVL